MQRVLIGTAAILLAAGSGVVIKVAAKASHPVAGAVPAYLKPVLMDAAPPATGPITIDIPSTAQFIRPTLSRHNLPGATTIPPPTYGISKSSLAIKHDPSRSGLTARRCRWGR